MRTSIQTLIASLLFLNPGASWANDKGDANTLSIDQALSALESKDYVGTVSKASEVIQRFEAGKDPNSNYICASGFADTLTSLFPATTAGSDQKKTTAAISPDICLAYFLKGFALIDLKRPTEALPFLEEAVALDPDNTQFLAELGEWHKSAGQWEKSLGYFTRASETTDMSITMMENKEQARAITDERKCRSYRGIAFNQAELKQWAKARDALKKCLAIAPNDPKSMQEMQYIEANEGK